ncbi:MAG: hypothetical protein A2V88_12060 [Elusimicrobia bacterium RBG_16_66_12]|nr:MAG: hypothetical protein A2V88_12060 [Elusimicrobia bacterium RBG_16_66_12]
MSGNSGRHGAREAARDLFLLRRRSKNLSDHSLSWYKYTLAGFFRFLEGVGAISRRSESLRRLRLF